MRFHVKRGFDAVRGLHYFRVELAEFAYQRRPER
jgi:hypothetical protein